MLTDTENVGIGLLAAFIEAVVLQPTLYWKNARAQGLPFTINPRIIYRGTGASLANEMQMMGVQFGITGALQRSYWQWRLKGALKNENTTTAAEEIGLATVAGMISAVFTSPVELIMINQQRAGGSIVAQLRAIAINKGLLQNGLGRGMGLAVLRDGIYVAGMLGVTPTLQSHLQNSKGYSEASAGLYASIVGGCLAAVISHPADLVKTCMQGDLEKSRFAGIRQTFAVLIAEGGVLRLYHGLMWRTINIVSTVYIANEVRVRASAHLLGSRSKVSALDISP